MSNIRRIYIEKKPGFNVEAEHVLADLKENLNIESLSDLRILNRYDVDGLDDEIYEAALKNIFSDPPADLVYENDFPCDNNESVFAVKYLPGQYDQRADSAVQCIQLMSKAFQKIQVETAKVYICRGTLSSRELSMIKSYCINPVDSMEASLEKQESLAPQKNELHDIKILHGFINKSDEELSSLREELGLAMSVEDLAHCREYFKSRDGGSDPTMTEIKVIDTYWSDHCRHTTFLTVLENVEFEEGTYSDLFKSAWNMYLSERDDLGSKRDICLMDMAVMGMKALRKKGLLDDLDESEEINACSIEVDVNVGGEVHKWLVMFKNETHNHPTEIEPYGGAATCLGGAIRDPLSGRSYVYHAMRVTGSGDPRVPLSDTLPGKLPQRKLTTTAAHGFSSYGNQIGLATGQVTELYHPGYVAKRMEIGAVIGAAPKEHVVRAEPLAGDVVLLVGGATGRDGCGGATGSSKEHTEKSLLNCGAEVQKGNPPTERKLQRLFRNSEVSRCIKRCNDFGAGGVSVAIGELADGLDIDLDAVPKKYEGLDGTELAISESQERMAVVVSKEDSKKFIAFAETENLEATVVAAVTDDRRMRMRWRGKTIVDISREFLNTNGARQFARVKMRHPKKYLPKTFGGSILDNLRRLDVCSQKGLSERFDSTIGKGTVLMPYGGKNQLTPPDAMAAKIPVPGGETSTATLMAFGANPSMMEWSCFHGAVCSVVESLAKIVATGGDYKRVRLSFQEYFEKMTDDPEKWGKPFSALLGAFYAQMKLGIPAIGGKDSMSGTFRDMNVPPTLASFAVGIADISHIISPEFKGSGHSIIRIDTNHIDDLPDFTELCSNFEIVHKGILEGVIVSAYALERGGLSAAVSKMSMGNGIGAVIEHEDIFTESCGAFVLECVLDENEVGQYFYGSGYQVIGKTTDDQTVVFNGETLTIDEIIAAWLEPLENVFPTEYFKDADMVKPLPIYTGALIRSTGLKTARPRILIPTFPGTNCEYDTKAEFDRAGGDAEIFVLRNQRAEWLKESLREFGDKIKQSQIIAIPGGFSAGDEPDGSAKFIMAVFKNKYIAECVMELLRNRDGLMLGICNGFQALLKLGLITYGEIRDAEPSGPTLTYNAIGRHVSVLSRTRIVSVKSPWLANCRPGDEHMVAVSHGEGRFVASEDQLQDLARNGQIVTQYVDQSSNPSLHSRHNPNGSMYGIEGLTSPDGRIFGKMGHSERAGHGIFKNVPGEKDQQIFGAGVAYYTT